MDQSGEGRRETGDGEGEEGRGKEKRGRSVRGGEGGEVRLV